MDPIDKLERLHQTMLGPDRIIEVPSHDPEELAEMRQMVTGAYSIGPQIDALHEIISNQEAQIEEMKAREERAKLEHLAERASDQAERKRQARKDRIWGFVLGVLSGVISTLLVQAIPGLIMKLTGQ